MKSISYLTTAVSIDSKTVFPVSTYDNNQYESYKTSLSDITSYVLDGLTPSDITELYNEVFPTNAYFSGSGVYTIGSGEQTPTVTWYIIKNGVYLDVTSAIVTYTVNGTTSTQDLTSSATYSSGKYSAKITLSDENVTTSTKQNGYASITVTGTFVASDNKTYTKTLTFYYVGYKYYGNVDEDWDATDSDNVASLTKASLSSSRTLTLTISKTAQCDVYAYPQGFGKLTSILDGSGFEYLSNYTLYETTITLNDISINYYVYKLNNASTVSSISMTYK